MKKAFIVMSALAVLATSFAGCASTKSHAKDCCCEEKTEMKDCCKEEKDCCETDQHKADKLADCCN